MLTLPYYASETLEFNRNLASIEIDTVCFWRKLGIQPKTFTYEKDLYLNYFVIVNLVFKRR